MYRLDGRVNVVVRHLHKANDYAVGVSVTHTIETLTEHGPSW